MATKAVVLREFVIALDPHVDVLVAVAVDGNGRQLDVKDATARPRGYRALLAWATKLGSHRWAVEDVRHGAGGPVRFLLAEDEQVVRVPTHEFGLSASSAGDRETGSDRRTRLCPRRTGGGPAGRGAGDGCAGDQDAPGPPGGSGAQDYLAARRALGDSNTEAISALKRHLARRVFTLVRAT
jgi:hypothetical protein